MNHLSSCVAAQEARVARVDANIHKQLPNNLQVMLGFDCPSRSHGRCTDGHRCAIAKVCQCSSRDSKLSSRAFAGVGPGCANGSSGPHPGPDIKHATRTPCCHLSLCCSADKPATELTSPFRQRKNMSGGHCAPGSTGGRGCQCARPAAHTNNHPVGISIDVRIRN